MRRLIAFLALIPIMTSGQTKNATPATSWDLIKYMVGHWQGTSDGEPGHGTVDRRYEFVLNNKFLQETNTSTYPVQEKNPKGEIHYHMGMFSYDRQRGKVIYRQFHMEGFVNQYALESVSPDGKQLVFVTESIENIPPGWRAKETWTIVPPDGFNERFELAEPAKDFSVYSENHLKRAKE